MAAIAGWTPGYYLVVAISLSQVVLFEAREESVMAFPAQVRLVYFALTLTGLWGPFVCRSTSCCS